MKHFFPKVTFENIIYICTFLGLLWPNNMYLYAPLGMFSTLCTALYTASWQFDNCVKYQVNRNH